MMANIMHSAKGVSMSLAIGRRGAIAVVAGVLPCAAWANPVELISRQEAAIPPPAQVPTLTRAVTRGPIIRLVSPAAAPAEITGNFWFRVEFAARGGGRIQPASLRIRYVRAWEIDLSERFKPFATATALEIREAVIPRGDHYLRVDIQDEDGRTGNTIIALRAA